MTVTVVIQALSWICLMAGSFFTLAGALGLWRMPELFTRMHAASVIDTLGAGFLILGMILQAGLTLVAVKLLLVLGLIFLTGPVITHALAQAAMEAGVQPKLAEDRSGRLDGGRQAPSGASPTRAAEQTAATR